MGTLGSKQDQLLSSFKVVPSRTPSCDKSTHSQKSIFATLRRSPTAKPSDFIPLFNEFMLSLTDTFNCTVMTPGQKVLLGADWVWAVLDKPTKNPHIQIAVQVLHLPELEGTHFHSKAEKTSDESMEVAQMAASDKNMCEKMVDFCASIGKDCYALFLFMGQKEDKDNIYGVLTSGMENDMLPLFHLCLLGTCTEKNGIMINMYSVWTWHAVCIAVLQFRSQLTFFYY
uniref:Uncharacterized protein n=1 Tax=Periophthalmus magnuspinnatus TaxID=409849 RepID=A0A3B4BBY9_9GOBI